MSPGTTSGHADELGEDVVLHGWQCGQGATGGGAEEAEAKDDRAHPDEDPLDDDPHGHRAAQIHPSIVPE
ncbi:MAG: hypothetical protein ACYCST_09095 [Acidimicrobiales bacterium]